MNYVPASVLTVLAMAPITPLFSQSAASSTESSDAEVVKISEFHVTESTERGYGSQYTLGGSRINMEISKTPISVVVFNSEFRFDSAALDIQELARYSAGVSAAANIGSGQISLRGQGLSASTFRDGIPGNTNAGEAPDYMDMALVERVEIIKGPAGTLFGAHNSGGMINYVSKRPLNRNQTTLYSIAEPSRHFMRGEVDDSRKLGGGWAYRAVLAYQKGTTMIGTRNDVKVGMVALSKSTKWVDLLFRVSRTERDWLNSGSWFLDVANNVSHFVDQEKPIGEADGKRDQDATNVDLEAEFKVNLAGLTVKNRLVGRFVDSVVDTFNYSAAVNNFRFFNAQGVQFGDASTTRFDDPRLASIIVTRGANLRLFNQKVWSVDYDAVTEFTTGPATHKALVYAEIAGTKRDADIFTATYPTLNLMNPVYYFPNTSAQRGPWLVSSRNHFETFANAVAVQDNISFWQDKLILVAGGRYDHAINDTFNKATARYTRADDARDGWTQKWAAVYRPIKELSLYYNYSETFQPTSTNIGGTVLPNVESNNNEAGVKVSLPNGRFSATASVFKVGTDNLVISVPVLDPATGAVITQSLPVGHREVRGWEIDFTSSLGAHFSLIGGLGKLTSRTETGLKTRGVSEALNYRAFGRWTLSLGPRAGSVFFGAGFEHTGPRPVDTQVTYMLPSMSVTDLLLGWRHGTLTLQANVTNAFNRIVARAGTTRADVMPTDPRSVRFSARWSF